MKVINGVGHIALATDPDMVLEYSYYEESQIHEFKVTWPKHNWYGHNFHSRRMEDCGAKLVRAMKEAEGR